MYSFHTRFSLQMERDSTDKQLKPSSTANEEPVIALLDMDCFYVQVEARENPALVGVPAAVVQYKTWKGGGIIAVNYEARAAGVTRQMRGDEVTRVPGQPLSLALIIIFTPDNQ